MGKFDMTEEEKKEILEQHKKATQEIYLKAQRNKEGLKQPEKKTEEPSK